MASLDATPLDAEELTHLAMQAAARDENDKAITLLKRAIELEPENGMACYLLGALHAEIGLFERAVEELQRAAELAPEIPTARFQLGLLLLTSGRVEEARQAWQELEKLGDSDPLYRFQRGLSRLADNDFSGCIDDLSTGIAANTVNPNLNTDMQRVLDSAHQLQAGEDGGNSGTDDGDSGRNALLSAYRRSQFDQDN